MIDFEAVCPSLEVAVTVYVCEPVVDVSRCPEPPLVVLVPLLSLQDANPGPPVPSAQEKVVATTCPTAYVPPDAGKLIVAVGAPATV